MSGWQVPVTVAPEFDRCYIRRRTDRVPAHPAVLLENHNDEQAPSASRCTEQSSRWVAVGSEKTEHGLKLRPQVLQNALPYV